MLVVRLCISGGAILVLMLLGNAFATEPPLVQPKRVLILHSHSRALPTTLEWERGITTGLEANMLELVAVGVEQLCDRLSELTKGTTFSFYPTNVTAMVRSRRHHAMLRSKFQGLSASQFLDFVTP